MEAPCRFKFTGTGGALFGQLFVGMILMIITFGLYTPWFVCKLTAWVNENTVLEDDFGNTVQLKFVGTGGTLFGIYIGGLLLSILTLGIYSFWFMVNVFNFFIENTTGETSDGEPVDLTFTGTGGELFGKMFAGYFLMLITLGIYTPWMICSLTRFFYDNTSILMGDGDILTLRFIGTGGELFGIYIGGMIFMILTLGIYQFWFKVNMMKFTMGNTEIITPDNNVLRMEFNGTGGELFGLTIVGIFLTVITLGIYYFWFLVSNIKFQTDNLRVRPA